MTSLSLFSRLAAPLLPRGSHRFTPDALCWTPLLSASHTSSRAGRDTTQVCGPDEASHHTFCSSSRTSPVGVPAVEQWVRNLTAGAQVSVEMQVPSPAPWVKDPVLLQLQKSQLQLRCSPWPRNGRVDTACAAERKTEQPHVTPLKIQGEGPSQSRATTEKRHTRMQLEENQSTFPAQVMCEHRNTKGASQGTGAQTGTAPTPWHSLLLCASIWTGPEMAALRCWLRLWQTLVPFSSKQSRPAAPALTPGPKPEMLHRAVSLQLPDLCTLVSLEISHA